PRSRRRPAPSASDHSTPRTTVKNTARSAARCAGNVPQPSPSAARKNANARRSVLRPSGIDENLMENSETYAQIQDKFPQTHLQIHQNHGQNQGKAEPL